MVQVVELSMREVFADLREKEGDGRSSSPQEAGAGWP